MYLLVCIAGLPDEVAARVTTGSPARFTGDEKNLPIVRRLKAPFDYRPGMSDYFHEELASRIAGLEPDDEVSVVLAYVNYPRSAASSIRQFFPFALTVPIEPMYLDAVPANTRKSALSNFVGAVELAVKNLRQRVAVVRDTLSGQNFSPLTLPVGNFESGVLAPTLEQLFHGLGTAQDARSVIQGGLKQITQRHPLILQL